MSLASEAQKAVDGQNTLNYYFDELIKRVKNVTSYNGLTDKPQINGVILEGNKTTDDLCDTEITAQSTGIASSKAVYNLIMGALEDSY